MKAPEVNNINEVVAKMILEMAETEEEFIFSKILPFCSEKMEMHVPKERLIRALQKQEKYRWHDLRKDQEDLPNVDERVEIVLDCAGRKVNNFATRLKTNGWAVNGFVTSLDVVAWRYIEPFEEVE